MYTFGLKTSKDSCMSMFDKNSPGPGTYTSPSLLNYNGPGAKFTTEKRNSINSGLELNNPSPQAYFRYKESEGPKYSFGTS